MAFDKSNFSGNLGAGSGAVKLYVFKDSASTKAQIAAADYFLDIYSILGVGDGVFASGSDGAVLLAVTASSSTTVTTEEATLV